MIDLNPASRAVIDLLEAVDPARFGDPTPCTEYTVADLLEHLDEVARGSAALARKVAGPATPGSPIALSDNSWRVTLSSRLRELAAAWSDPAAWQGTTDVGVELPNTVWGATALTELVVHGWDLAQALDRPFILPESTLNACLDHVIDFVPNAPLPDLWGATVTVSDRAPLLDRIVAITGRTP